MVIKDFLIRQFARFRFFVNRFSFFFTMFNFINIMVLMLVNIGVRIDWYWLLVIYVSVSFLGLVLTFMLECFGSWKVDFLQTWKMSASKLYKEKTRYQAIMIEIFHRKTDEELLELKEKIEEGWE